MSALSETLAARLAALDSCAVSDALDRLGLTGAVTGIAGLSLQRRIAGPVTTVKLAAGKPNGTSARHLCTGAIDAASAGMIVVVEQRTGADAAGWGGVLSRAAQFRGLAGVIVDGPARDIDESRAIGFPVYARGTTARTARGRIYEEAFGCKITIGDVSVAPDDWVLADASGIVFIGADKIEQVLVTAERIAAREALMVAAIEEGKPSGVVMGADYESMLDAAKDQ